MTPSKTVGIILAAGKGKRLNSTDTNKTALLFNGKPMIQYAVELFGKTVGQTVVVTGFAPQRRLSVRFLKICGRMSSLSNKKNYWEPAMPFKSRLRS